MRAALVVIASLAIGLATATGAPQARAATPAAGDPASVSTVYSDPDAVSAAIDLERTARDFETTDRRLAQAQAKLTSAEAALADATARVQAGQAKVDQLQAIVRLQASQAYVHSSSSQVAALSITSVEDLETGRSYAEARVRIDDEQLSTLEDRQQDLERDRDQAAAARDAMADEVSTLDTARQELADRSNRDASVLNGAGAVPIMGDSYLTAAELADWFRSTGAVAQLAPGTTIDDLANLYIVEGAAEHVRGDIAFAQSIVETASFSVDAGNNYAGIGVCDTCVGGYVFPSPLDGVRAQIQLLRNYADPDVKATSLADPPSPTLYGADPRKAASTYDSFFLNGKAPLWNQMGNGNWATSTAYAQSVISTYSRMVVWAQAQRR
jgi:hypothetical protein